MHESEYEAADAPPDQGCTQCCWVV